MMSNELNNKVTQVQEAILSERQRREYAVVVGIPQRTYAICGIRIPGCLEAYYAETTCTVKHEHGIPCQWIDYAFLLPNGERRIFLWNDLLRGGMLLEQSIRAIFADLQAQVETAEASPIGEQECETKEGQLEEVSYEDEAQQDLIIEVPAGTPVKTLHMIETTINHALEHPGARCAVFAGTSQKARGLFARYSVELGQSVRFANSSQMVIQLTNDSSIHFFWLTDQQRSRGYHFDDIAAELVKNPS